MQIKTVIEGKRGCGYRKKGGLYLVSGSGSSACGKLPIPLTVCPCCGAGIKFSRGFTWINSDLFEFAICERLPYTCDLCPANFEPGAKLGLLWIGEVYYKTTFDFDKEASLRGISRRIAAVPRGFKVGETWIALAHIKAIDGKPGIFSFFKPSRIEYVITGKETDDELNELEKRGLTIVKVIRDIDTQTEMRL